MEVRARELEGRLLLALAAAERGHHVLLGDLRSMLSHRRWLPPGIYHDKSVTPSDRKIAAHGALVAAGFRVTSQDEEHGLLERDFDTFAARRYSGTSVGQVDAVMMWGPHDEAVILRRHPESAGKVHATGSPRVDLWRPEMADLYRELPLPGIDATRPYVLFVSNTVAVKKNPLWLDIRNKRPSYFHGDDDATEWARYRKYAEHTLYAGEVVRALRLAARRHQDLQFVVRPHPDEGEGVWDDLIGRVPNVTVNRHGGIGRWVRGAHLVMHNGCTTGFEAAVPRVPLVSFQPGGWQADVASNRLGRVAHDIDELSDLITAAHEPATRSTWFSEDSDELLSGRFAALHGRLAADRIVDVWEELGDPPGGTRRMDLRRARTAGAVHRGAGRLRQLLRRARQGQPQAATERRFVTAHKFPPLTASDVEPLVEGLRRATGRFTDVRVTRVAGRLIELRRVS
jgi:surface carbohydrate biosynthesis protein